MPSTIRDVAAAAGVSPATVSRVLNGKEDVGAHLRTRVLGAVHDLGYRPNGPARSLRTRAALVLGVVISDVTNPFFTAMVRGVEDQAQQAGYSIVLANADEDVAKEARYLEVAAAEQMAGVLLSPASKKTRINVLTDRGIPVVTIDRRLSTVDVDSVTVNNHQAARQATRHLLDQGCHRIGFVGGPTDTTTGASRLAGYRAGLKDTGIPVDPTLITCADFRTEGGYRATRRLLELQPPPDGLVVANNLMTIGALQAIAQTALAIPGDITVVGFDDVPWATALHPPLTVVAQPTYQIGVMAAQLLLRRIRGEQDPPRHLVLKAELIERASTRRPS